MVISVISMVISVITVVISGISVGISVISVIPVTRRSLLLQKKFLCHSSLDTVGIPRQQRSSTSGTAGTSFRPKPVSLSMRYPMTVEVRHFRDNMYILAEHVGLGIVDVLDHRGQSLQKQFRCHSSLDLPV